VIAKPLVIAVHTLREAIRRRVFLNIAVFGVGMVLLSMVVAQITFGETGRVVRSIGLSGVTLAIDLMALLLAISSIHEEIDRKTLFVVLARPLTRWQYVLGRYVGLCLTLLLALAGFSVVFVVTLTFVNASPTMSDAAALLAVFPEAAILAGFGMVLSTITTPMLGAGMGLGFWAAAASTDDLVGLTKKAAPEIQELARVVYYVLPSFSRLNFRDQAVYEQPVSMADLSAALSYGAVYAGCLVALASFSLTRKEMI
jgi:ABC-type transport system involved in multi-copper enzyme maturation permease subunit